MEVIVGFMANTSKRYTVMGSDHAGIPYPRMAASQIARTWLKCLRETLPFCSGRAGLGTLLHHGDGPKKDGVACNHGTGRIVELA